MSTEVFSPSILSIIFIELKKFWCKKVKIIQNRSYKIKEIIKLQKKTLGFLCQVLEGNRKSGFSCVHVYDKKNRLLTSILIHSLVHIKQSLFSAQFS